MKTFSDRGSLISRMSLSILPLSSFKERALMHKPQFLHEEKKESEKETLSVDKSGERGGQEIGPPRLIYIVCVVLENVV